MTPIYPNADRKANPPTALFPYSSPDDSIGKGRDRMPKLEISRIHDAYKEGGPCPLCACMEGVERSYLLSFQGSRVMEPNVRVKTNESGFCPNHYQSLYIGENKLGLGLVVHTHLKEKIPGIKAAIRDVIEGGDALKGRRGRDSMAERLDALADSLQTLISRCFICGMLAQDLDRYCHTIVYLWKSDPDFPSILRSSSGFCLSHFVTIISKAREMLHAEELSRFLREVAGLMTGSLESLERDLFNFTQLFHDANRSLGTENERTALLRTLQMLAGRPMRRE
jgi:hypothetical protein